MRIQFSLTCQKGIVIPINYQSEISSWIFDALAKAGSELSSWVQKRGFDVSKRNYKSFTFSPLAIFPYEMNQEKQEFKLLGNQVKINISIYLDAEFEQQVVNLFRQTPLKLGMIDGKQAQFEIKHWQIMKKPEVTEYTLLKAISPISLTTLEETKSNNPFLMPENEMYEVAFFTHVMRRFKAANEYKSLAEKGIIDPAFPHQFLLSGVAKSRLIHLKPNPDSVLQIRGFTYDFELAMQPAFFEYCYSAGFGEHTHLGFGFVDIRT